MENDKDIMKLFVRKYFTDKVKYLIAVGGAVMSASAFLWLIGTRIVFIAFLVLLLLFPLLSVFIWDFYHRWRYYYVLTGRLTALNEKTLLHDVIEEADFAEGILLQRLLTETDLYLNNQIADAQRRMGEYRDYVEVWVHEIKMPITVLELLMDKMDDNIKAQSDERFGTKDPDIEISARQRETWGCQYEKILQAGKQIRRELKKIDMLAEQALYYARSTFVAKDFMTESIRLEEMVSEALKKKVLVKKWVGRPYKSVFLDI